MNNPDLAPSDETSSQTNTRPRLTTRVGYMACAWAVLFILPHIYWAIGGTAGLAGHPMKGALLYINLVAIPLLLIAAVVALAAVQSWGQAISRWLLIVLLWGIGIVLTVRGTIGLVQRIFSISAIWHQPILALFADPWFILGGMLFNIVAWNYSRQPKKTLDDRHL